MDYTYMLRKILNMTSKEDKFAIIVDDIERRIMVQALVDLKDKQKAEGKSFDFLDGMILKVCDAPQAKSKALRQYESR